MSEAWSKRSTQPREEQIQLLFSSLEKSKSPSYDADLQQLD